MGIEVQVVETGQAQFGIVNLQAMNKYILRAWFHDCKLQYLDILQLQSSF